MTWRLDDVERLTVATGRRLLRVGAAGDNQIELVFERNEGEAAEFLVTVQDGRFLFGQIDLPTVEGMFGREYGVAR